MRPEFEPLVMYGQPAEGRSLEWSWVDGELGRAGVYWIAVNGADRPQTRPVWGVWRDERVLLSVGTPKVNAALEVGTPVVVHLGGDVDVVIVEGRMTGTSDDTAAVEAYNVKYAWDYRPAAYGDFIVIEPDRVIAWRSAGEAGREGFQETGKWRFGTP